MTIPEPDSERYRRWRHRWIITFTLALSVVYLLAGYMVLYTVHWLLTLPEPHWVGDAVFITGLITWLFCNHDVQRQKRNRLTTDD